MKNFVELIIVSSMHQQLSKFVQLNGTNVF